MRGGPAARAGMELKNESALARSSLFKKCRIAGRTSPLLSA
jgi:hypothetical protein